MIKKILPPLALFAFLLFSVITFSSCKKEPELLACFNSDLAIVKPTQIVTFNNCSKNAERTEWNFSDGTSSSIGSPTHTWSTLGVYAVKMTVYNGTKSKTVSKTICVTSFNGNAYIDIKMKYPNVDYSSFFSSSSPPNYMFCRIYASKSPYKNDMYTFIAWGGYSNSSSPTTIVGTDSYPNEYAYDKYIIDNIGKYRFKFVVYGQSSSTVIPVDSIITNEVDVFSNTAIKGSAKLNKTANLTYTTSFGFN